MEEEESTTEDRDRDIRELSRVTVDWDKSSLLDRIEQLAKLGVEARDERDQYGEMLDTDLPQLLAFKRAKGRLRPALSANIGTLTGLARAVGRFVEGWDQQLNPHPLNKAEQELFDVLVVFGGPPPERAHRGELE